jgi:hypothetical protein
VFTVSTFSSLLVILIRVTLHTAGVDWTVWGVTTCRDKRFYCSEKCPDWLWGQPHLLVNGDHGSFPEHKAGAV